MASRSRLSMVVRGVSLNPKARAMTLGVVILLAIAAVVVVTARLAAASRRPLSGQLPAAGYEYLLALITSSNCFACKHPELPTAVGEIREALSSDARLVAQSVRTIAGIINTDPTDGMRFISEFGRFDEYSFGGNWENSVARHFLSRPEVRRAGTPTLVIARRAVELGPDRVMRLSPDTVLVALIGLESIRQFASDLRSRWAFPRILGSSADTSLASPRVP